MVIKEVKESKEFQNFPYLLQNIRNFYFKSNIAVLIEK